MKSATLFLVALSLITLSGFDNNRDQIRPEFKKYYDEFAVDGSFVLYDTKNDSYTYYNQEQSAQAFLPASTFKICNSLIGLETGVIADQHFIIKWDSVKRFRTEWNQDLDLSSAYKYSAVWYYQELARRVGASQMQAWLTKAQYGNANISGGIDLFWLKGGLRITPRQQIEFLKKLNTNKLPFSKRSVDIVKQIMIEKQTNAYTIRSKTGWAIPENHNIGWYVGYIETADNTYYFATCVQKDGQIDDIRKITKPITYKILNDLHIVTIN